MLLAENFCSVSDNISNVPTWKLSFSPHIILETLTHETFRAPLGADFEKSHLLVPMLNFWEPKEDALSVEEYTYQGNCKQFLDMCEYILSKTIAIP